MYALITKLFLQEYNKWLIEQIKGEDPSSVWNFSQSEHVQKSGLGTYNCLG